MGHIDSLGWGILAGVVAIIGIPNLIFARHLRADPDWQPPNRVIAIRIVGIAMVIFMPLMFITLPNPPLTNQPSLGLIQFSYLAICYFTLWLLWKRTNDWRMKFCLLILFIFLPDYLWLMNLAANNLRSEQGSSSIARLIAGVQLVYVVAGYLVFKHYFAKIRPQQSATAPKQDRPAADEDPAKTFPDWSR